MVRYSVNQGPVARSLVSANRWLRGIKMHRFPWYLTLVSTNHASSNPGQAINDKKVSLKYKILCLRSVTSTIHTCTSHLEYMHMQVELYLLFSLQSGLSCSKHG